MRAVVFALIVLASVATFVVDGFALRHHQVLSKSSGKAAATAGNSLTTTAGVDSDLAQASEQDTLHVGVSGQAQGSGSGNVGNKYISAQGEGDGEVHGEASAQGTENIGVQAGLVSGTSAQVTIGGKGKIGAGASGSGSASVGNNILKGSTKGQGQSTVGIEGSGTGTGTVGANWVDGAYAKIHGEVHGNAGGEASASGSGTFGNDVAGGSAKGEGKGKVGVDVNGFGSGTIGASLKDGAHVKAEGSFNAEATAEGSFSGSGESHVGDCDYTISICGSVTLTGTAKAVGVVTGKGEASANVGLLSAGAKAQGSVEAKADAEANLDGHIVINHVASAEGTLRGTAQASASANGHAEATFDFKTLSGSVGLGGQAQASASVAAEAQGSFKVGDWLEGNGQVGISYGASIGVGGGFLLSEKDCTFVTSGNGLIKGVVGGTFSGNIAVNPCKLVTSTFESLGDAISELASIGAKDGERCFWGPNCEGFVLSGSGMDCCQNTCQTRVFHEDSQQWGCKEGLITGIEELMETSGLGDSCVVGLQCQGYQFLGEGVECCKSTCTTKVKDFLGNYWCPDVAIVSAEQQVKLGGQCSNTFDCEGYTLLGSGNFCCPSPSGGPNTCQAKIQDWAGIYYCPTEAVVTKPLGQGCAMGGECQGYTLLGEGADCCLSPNGGGRTCQNRIKDWAGVYYCPTEAVVTKPLGQSCGVGVECQGYTLLGEGADCCPSQDGGGKSCQNRIKDWAGVYYCPTEAVVTKPLGQSCGVGVECQGYTLLGEGADCCPSQDGGGKSCQNRIKDWAGVYYCPSQAVLKKPVGEGCVLGAECQDYNAFGEGTECCWFKCQRKSRNWLGAWGCP